jgi:formylglycine-generating enzyme required for sulfatase activity
VKIIPKLFLGIPLLIMSLLSAGCTPSIYKDMILIEAGEFEMGGEADLGLSTCLERYQSYGDLECKLSDYEDEEPVHTVYLDGYYIDKYEVTNAAYQVCVEEGVCDPPKQAISRTRQKYFGNPDYDDFPVIYVSWFDAQTFCEWRDARLPTEAEWEKAARGTDGRVYPWGDGYDGEAGNFCNRDDGYHDGYEDTAPVGSYQKGASPYGVMDMAGNVSEWVADIYAEDYFITSPAENPLGPSEGCCRVLKGGTWKCEGTYCVRTADRVWWFPDYKYDFIGFRCAATPP